MIYVMLCVVFALVMGPVLWLRPSRRDRFVAGLRQRAVQQGLRVQCPIVKQVQWAAGNLCVDPARFARYAMALDADAIDTTKWEEWHRVELSPAV